MDSTDRKVFQQIFEEAQTAGREAVAQLQVIPMAVQQAEGLFDQFDPSKPYEVVADGACGFAWVNVRPGTSKFAKWLKESGNARADSYYGGVTIWISSYNQSVQKKEAHAEAMAKVLRDNGIKAYAASRLD